jgi:ATP-dependent RNA helicase DDX42
VSGASVPKPVSSFGHLGFPESLIRAVRKADFTQPTPIQAQGIPIALQGRDIIGKLHLSCNYYREWFNCVQVKKC